MTTYGLTDDGFEPKTMEVIRDETNARLRARFSPSMPLGNRTALGQLVAIVAGAFGSMWSGMQAVYAAFDPDAATGAQLEALAALTGTFRQPARKSTIPVILTGTTGTPVPAGSKMRPDSSAAYAGPTDEFELDAEVTLAAATAWAISTVYAIGDIRATAAGQVFICVDAGTSAGSGTGPSNTYLGVPITEGIVDGTCEWDFLGLGNAYAEGAATAVEDGPVGVALRDLTEIRTPVSGWSGVINLEIAVPGASEQTDAGLRISRAAEVAGAGTGTRAALRANLLQVTGVTTVTIFANNTNATDGDGVPAHSVEALIQGGSDQDLFDALLANVVLGIGYHGTETGTSEDSEGEEHTIKFSRPVEVPIYVAITIVKDPDEYPTDGDDQVKAAIVAYAATVAVGRNAVSSVIGAQALGVAGVLEVTTTFIKLSASPTLPTTLTITSRQILTIIAANIGVTASDGTP